MRQLRTSVPSGNNPSPRWPRESHSASGARMSKTPGVPEEEHGEQNRYSQPRETLLDIKRPRCKTSWTETGWQVLGTVPPVELADRQHTCPSTRNQRRNADPSEPSDGCMDL